MKPIRWKRRLGLRRRGPAVGLALACADRARATPASHDGVDGGRRPGTFTDEGVVRRPEALELRCGGASLIRLLSRMQRNACTRARSSPSSSHAPNDAQYQSICSAQECVRCQERTCSVWQSA